MLSLLLKRILLRNSSYMSECIIMQHNKFSPSATAVTARQSLISTSLCYLSYCGLSDRDCPSIYNGKLKVHHYKTIFRKNE